MILLHIAVAALYAFAAWALWPREQAGGAPKAALWLVPIAILAHGFLLARTVFAADGLDLSFANALSLVAGLATLVAFASGLLQTLPRVVAVVLPFAAAGALLPSITPNPHHFPYANAPWAALHIAVALIAYGFFLVAALQAVVLTGLERRLHHGLDNPVGETPPLLTLERYLFRLVGAGFVLLTVALGSGFLFSEELFGKPVTFTHKNFFSVLGWLAFAILLFGRWRFGWRGRRALRWILGGTLLLVLGYLGEKFVLEVILRR